MKNSFFSQIARYTVCFFKYLLYLFNLAVLAGLGVKTVNLWISTPFDFSDTMAAFPGEPEFADKVAAEKQFWGALTFETLVFVIGGFLCYELLIKQKTFRRGITAPLAGAFLWAAGESAFLFLPATDKVHTINVCRAADISWDAKNHKCRLMDLELKRFERLKALKTIRRPAAAVKKTTPPAAKAAPAPKAPTVPTAGKKKAAAPKKKTAVPAPAAEKKATTTPAEKKAPAAKPAKPTSSSKTAARQKLPAKKAVPEKPADAKTRASAPKTAAK